MQAVIQREFEGYTVVMVTHRLEMVKGFDRLVVMDKGTVIETGHPEELVRRDGGSLQRL
jgi:ABC-type multidrug transport system fused ATPase/permease subunit